MGDGNPHGKSPADHSPSGQSRGERRSQRRGGGDSRSDSGSGGGSERGDDDSDFVGGGSRGAGRGALALRKAKSSAKHASGGAWEREPGTTEYGRAGGGSRGRGGKQSKSARVAAEPRASTGGKAAVERALPPDAERIEAARSVREAVTCLPEEMVRAMEVMGEGAPRGWGVPEKQAGMVPFSSLVMEKTEYEASVVGGDGAQALLSVMGASGMIKASVKKSPEALEQAVYTLASKFKHAINKLDAAADRLAQEDFSAAVVVSITKISSNLTRELDGMWFIYEKWHKQAVAQQVARGVSEKEAHARALDSLGEQAVWQQRGLPGPPTALHSLAHAAQVGAVGGGAGGQQRQQADAVLHTELLGAVKTAVAAAIAGKDIPRGADGGGLCKNCFQTGHKFWKCTKPMVCRVCRKPGHKQGDAACGGSQ